MIFKAATYNKGIEDALGIFGVGVRVASDLSMGRGMPDGPEHLGAEWLARTLRSDTESYLPQVDRRQPRSLDRPVRWSNPSSLESANSTSRGVAPMGVGAFSGV